MDILNVMPFIMLFGFTLFSVKSWKGKAANETILMICMGWSAISIFSFASSIIFVVFGKILLPIALLLISIIAYFVALRFKHAPST